MKRLVYSPKVYAFVRSDAHGMVNLSDFIVSGSVERKINMVSAAELTIRNPNMVFTKGAREGKPYFRPMDPITIWLQRIQGAPVQAFTGYLDQTPYLQLYPGVCTLRASCTLKRLMHTYWDPALQFTADFLQKYGWTADRATGTLKNEAAELYMDKIDKLIEGDDNAKLKMDDGSIGRLLYVVMQHIGGWDKNAIHIEELPETLIQNVMDIYGAYSEDSKEIKKQLGTFFKAYIGDGKYGGGSGGDSSGGDGGDLVSGENVKKIFCYFEQGRGVKPEIAAGFCGNFYHESHWNPSQHQVGGPAKGLAQWEGGRKEALDAFARSKGKKWDDLLLQLDFIWHELQGSEAAAWAKIKANSGSVEAATLAIRQYYERPSAHADASRVKAAKQVYAKYKGKCGDEEDKEKTTETGKDADNAANRAAGRASVSASAAATASSGTQVVPAASISSRSNTGEPARDAPAEEKDDKLTSPVKGLTAAGIGGGGRAYGAPRGYGPHAGVDANSKMGEPWYAIADGEVVYWGSGFLWYKIKGPKGYPDPLYIGYYLASASPVKKGDKIKAGQRIATGGTHGSGPHLHFMLRKDMGSTGGGDMDPTAFLKAAAAGKTPTGGSGDSVGGGGSGGGSGVGWEDVLSAAKASAFVQEMEFPGQAEALEAFTLTGHKALLNDKPLLPFIEQMTGASLRSFQSLPNGDFYAFYPDYFGHDLHRSAYWKIHDIEILDAQIELSDEALATHVFAVGNILHPAGVGSLINRMSSSGIVNIFNVQQSGFNPDMGEGQDTDQGRNNEKERKEAQKERLGRIKSDPLQVTQFLQKYGARPHVEESPLIKNQFYEAFMAYHTFNLLWSQQFLTEIQTTFMPELYPGGLVEFADHGIQCFIEGVTHTFDYESGFTTQTLIKAPASTGKTITTDPVSHGMVRAFTGNTGTDK